MSSPLSEAGIRSLLGKKYENLPITVYPVIDSTNRAAIDFAREKSAAENTPAVFIADAQTAGRGRIGRSFLSPGGRGIYMTILLPRSAWQSGRATEISPTLITSYTGVIACRALESLFLLEPKIKWVNDIYLSGRKLAGILVQGVLDDTGATFDYAAVGIGINAHGEELPPEIAHIATTLEREIKSSEVKAALSREVIAAKIIELFLDSLGELGTHTIAEEYRKRSFLVGKDITVMRVLGEYPAHILGINDNCELLLRLEDGSEEILATGEVSVREVKQ